MVGLEAAAGIEWEIVHLLESLFKKAGEVVKMWVVEVVRRFRSIYVVNLDNRRPARIKKWCVSSACSEWQGNVMKTTTETHYSLHTARKLLSTP